MPLSLSKAFAPKRFARLIMPLNLSLSLTFNSLTPKNLAPLLKQAITASKGSSSISAPTSDALTIISLITLFLAVTEQVLKHPVLFTFSIWIFAPHSISLFR